MMDMNISDMEVHDIALPSGTVLHQKYIIDMIYYWGQTGIVYLSVDQETGRNVVVKEYCPYYLANRDLDGKTVICKGRSFERSFEKAKEAFAKECQIVRKVSDLNQPWLQWKCKEPESFCHKRYISKYQIVGELENW